VEQRITLITLGVTDLARSTAFFERLGWQRSVREAPGVAFFQCGGLALSLYPISDLANDLGVSPTKAGFGGITLAHNVRNREDVAIVLREAEAAGAEIVRDSEEAFWGGQTGYFKDLDGYYWEVAWNPGFPLGEDGAVSLPV
jgi:catechol 2,3-dioxygenase-like lactoylglutathione lyase family enzyme